MPSPSLYILYSPSLDRYYVGSTIDVSRRLHEHTRYNKHFTSKARDWRLVFSSPCESLAKAREHEHWLKRQKDRRLIQRIVQDQVMKKVGEGAPA